MKRVGRRLLRGVGGVIARQSRIGAAPVFEPSVFPWTADLEAGWLGIRKELDALLEERERLPAFHEVSADQWRISRGDRWKILPFYVFGDRVDGPCRRCPETARLLAAIPGLRNAMFSILAPRYHVPAHRGPTNGVVRVHLGLLVPDDAERCRIRVGDRILHWREGRCLVFDDFYEHEVWNDTDEPRAVLFLDVDRPLRPVGRLVQRAVVAGLRRSAYVRDARRNAEALALSAGPGPGVDSARAVQLPPRP